MVFNPLNPLESHLVGDRETLFSWKLDALAGDLLKCSNDHQNFCNLYSPNEAKLRIPKLILKAYISIF